MDPVASSLLSGVVGALVGAFLIVIGQWLDRRRREHGAGRAVHMEMVHNATMLEALAEDGSAWAPISDRVWLSQLATIAAALRPDEFRTVAIPYVFVPYGEGLRTQLLAGRPLEANDRQVLLSTAREFTQGADLLRVRFWPGYGPQDVRRTR